MQCLSDETSYGITHYLRGTVIKDTIKTYFSLHSFLLPPKAYEVMSPMCDFFSLVITQRLSLTKSQNYPSWLRWESSGRAEQYKAHSLWEIVPFLLAYYRNMSPKVPWILNDKDKRDRSRYPKDESKRHRPYSESRNRMLFYI